MNVGAKWRCGFWIGVLLVCFGLSIGSAPWSWAQTASSATDEPPQPGKAEEVVQAPERVEVDPTAQDEEIASRLQRILASTQWFHDQTVRVDNGVVFLEGRTQEIDHNKVGQRGGAAYPGCCCGVNRRTVIESSIWDLSPAWAELRSLWRQTIQALPLLLLAIVLLILTWFATLGTVRLAHRFLAPRMPNGLLLGVAEKVFGFAYSEPAPISFRSILTPCAASVSFTPSWVARRCNTTPLGFCMAVTAGPLPALAPASAETYTPSKSVS